MDLDLFHLVSLFLSAITNGVSFRLLGDVLSQPRGRSRVSPQEQGWPNFGALVRAANCPREPERPCLSSLVFPFIAATAATTPDLLPSLKRRRLRQPSPHHRITAPFHQWLIGRLTETLGRRRTSPVMVSNRAFPGDSTQHPHCRPSMAVCSTVGGFRNPQRFNEWRCLAYVAAESATSRNLSSWPLRDTPFFRSPRWSYPGCLTFTEVVKFEKRVLYKYGLAQVGLDDRFHPPSFISPFVPR